MVTITVTRDQVERILGSGNARHSPQTLARQIGEVIARKFHVPEFGSLDISKIQVDKAWDGRTIKLTFAPEPDSPYKDIESAAQRVLNFFKNPESRHDIVI